MPGCAVVCGYAPNDYAPSRILGACWVQSVIVSICLGRGMSFCIFRAMRHRRSDVSEKKRQDNTRHTYRDRARTYVLLYCKNGK